MTENTLRTVSALLNIRETLDIPSITSGRTDRFPLKPLDNGADMAYNPTIRKRQLLRIVG